MTFKHAKERLKSLGYILQKDYRLDPYHPYTTYPVGGGSINYFMKIGDVKRYILNVEEVRRMQGVL